MYKTSKSPRKVLLTAYAVGKDALPQYAHRFSPHKFTQHQLLAVLVLKEFSRCDYRKVSAMLTDCPDLCRAIDLKVVPHFTTIQKAAQRLLILPKAKVLLRTTLELARKKSS